MMAEKTVNSGKPPGLTKTGFIFQAVNLAFTRADGTGNQ